MSISDMLLAGLDFHIACSPPPFRSDCEVTDTNTSWMLPHEIDLVTQVPPVLWGLLLCGTTWVMQYLHFQPGEPARLVMLHESNEFDVQAGAKLPTFALGMVDHWGNRTVPSSHETWKASRPLISLRWGWATLLS